VIEPRVEMMYLRPSDEDDDGLVPCNKDEATMTQFVFSSIHPVDLHEFGLSLAVTGVVDEVGSHYWFKVEKAMEKYLADHPDGETVDA
jgi:hypothetical protein